MPFISFPFWSSFFFTFIFLHNPLTSLIWTIITAKKWGVLKPPQPRCSTGPVILDSFVYLLLDITHAFCVACLSRKDTGITWSPVVCYCHHHCLLWKRVNNNIWLYPPHALMDSTTKLGHRCNMGTLICWWGQRSYINIKGHLRSSCKMKMLKWPHLKSWSLIWTKLGLKWSNVTNQGQRSSEVNL